MRKKFGDKVLVERVLLLAEEESEEDEEETHVINSKT